jgi:hypothetical protein
LGCLPRLSPEIAAHQFIWKAHSGTRSFAPPMSLDIAIPLTKNVVAFFDFHVGFSWFMSYWTLALTSE